MGQSKEMEPNSTGPTNLNIFLYVVLSRIVLFVEGIMGAGF